MSLKDKVFQNHNEVELRTMNKCYVLGNSLMYIDENNDVFYKKHISDYNDKLLYINNKNHDIMRVTNPFTKEVIYERDEVDWKKVSEAAQVEDIKVIVSNNGKHWINAYLKKYNSDTNDVTVFSDGKTRFTSDAEQFNDVYKKFKLYKD